MRRRIARDYCRSILWLDDEIRPLATEPSERLPYDTFFHPITEDFHKNGILCQLKGFPQITGDDDPFAAESNEIEICRNLAKKADIIILDWHLGAQDATHSSKILTGLIEAKGTRFVIILSRSLQLSEQFESAYGNIFKQSGTGWYRSDNGQFAYLLQKSTFKEKGSGKLLLDLIYDEMAVVYPDYLHWAAIEIAARIKEFSPQWLASLPSETDLAILAEHIHSDEDIGHAIFENILEDLKESIGISAVESLQAHSLNATDWPKADSFKSTLQKDIESVPKDQTKLIERMRSMLPLGADIMPPLKDLPLNKILDDERGATLDSIIQFKASVDRLGDFSENISLKPDATSRIRMGSVFRSGNALDSNKIWICVSQSCDCLRCPNLLFLMGMESDKRDGKKGATFLRFQQKQYVFDALAENLLPMAVEMEPRSLPHFTQVGVLREVTVTRLIARYWGQTTRVGINQPLFIRKLRGEQ